MPSQLTVALIVIFLGLTTLASLGITAWLIYLGATDTATVVAISGPGTTALGGLIGLLAHTSQSKHEGGS